MNKFKFFVFFIIFGLIVAVFSFLKDSNIDSREKGILLSSGILKDSLFKDPVVVSYDGKKSMKYRYQPYVSLSEKFFPSNSNANEFNQFNEFLKASNQEGYLWRSISDAENRNFVFYFSNLVSQNKKNIVKFWSFNINDRSYKEISGDSKEYGGCDWPIYLDSTKNELVTVDAVDVGSILEITEVCKINVLNGDVIGTFKMPYKETVQLFDYYVDANNRKIVFEDANVVLDIDSMSGKIIEIPGWDDFEIVSEKIFDGKIVIASNSNNEDGATFFVVYDINTNEVSKVMQIGFENSSFVDISPNSKHILFRHFVRDSNLKGNGNGYYCYVVVDSQNLLVSENICSIDSDKNPRSFIGWVE